MRQASKRIPDSAEKTVRDIRRPPVGIILLRRRSASYWRAFVVRSALLRLLPKEGINQNLYYRWSKEFLEAGKKRLAGDTTRKATTDEVKELRSEARHSRRLWLKS